MSCHAIQDRLLTLGFFEKNRIYAGVTFELTKNIESECYYVWESRESDSQWKELNALGFQIEILF